MIVQDLLRRRAKTEDMISIAINFSAQTSSPRTQEMIEVPLEKRGTRETLGGPGTHSSFFFFLFLFMFDCWFASR